MSVRSPLSTSVGGVWSSTGYLDTWNMPICGVTWKLLSLISTGATTASESPSTVSFLFTVYPFSLKLSVCVIIQKQYKWKAHTKHKTNTYVSSAPFLVPKDVYCNSLMLCVPVLRLGVRAKQVKLSVVTSTSSDKCILWHGHLCSRTDSLLTNKKEKSCSALNTESSGHDHHPGNTFYTSAATTDQFHHRFIWQLVYRFIVWSLSKIVNIFYNLSCFVSPEPKHIQFNDRKQREAWHFHIWDRLIGHSTKLQLYFI